MDIFCHNFIQDRFGIAFLPALIDICVGAYTNPLDLPMVLPMNYGSNVSQQAFPNE